MKTRILLFALTAIAAVTSLGCSSGSSNSAPASAEAITITPNPITTPGGTPVVVTPTGGTPPYTFVLSSTSGVTLGTLASSTTYTQFTGSQAGTGTLIVTDALGLSASAAVTVTTTGAAGAVNNALGLNPMGGSVALGGTLSFSASGGSGTYYYEVISPAGAGSFSGNVYYAPNTVETVTIEVYDTAGNATQTTVSVGGSGVQSYCNGTFSLDLDYNSGTITFNTVGTSGAMTGSMTLGPDSASFSGTCANGSVSFTDPVSGDPFSGTFYVDPSNPAIGGIWVGTFIYLGQSYPWSAQ